MYSGPPVLNPMHGPSINLRILVVTTVISKHFLHFLLCHVRLKSIHMVSISLIISIKQTYHLFYDGITFKTRFLKYQMGIKRSKGYLPLNPGSPTFRSVSIRTVILSIPSSQMPRNIDIVLIPKTQTAKDVL